MTRWSMPAKEQQAECIVVDRHAAKLRVCVCECLLWQAAMQIERFILRDPRVW